MKRLRLCPLLLALSLALTLTACGSKPAPYPLDAGQIRAHTEYLSETLGIRVTGTPEERACCDWLEEQLTGMGFSTETDTLRRVPFQGLGELESENLIAVCNPESTGPVLCVMAHYDTVPTSPGARDNSASVAILLELARYLGPRHTGLDAQVRLLFLGSEENGYHGSRAYVESLTEEDRGRHLAAFNMDISVAGLDEDACLVTSTLGGGSEGTYQEGSFMEPVDNLVSRTVREVHSELYGGEAVPLFHYGESDHRSFHEAGIDAANVCWRTVNGPLPTLYADYHQLTDTPEHLNYETAVETGRCVLASLFRLAG